MAEVKENKILLMLNRKKFDNPVDASGRCYKGCLISLVSWGSVN